MKIKHNLLTWLQIMMIYPVSAFLLIFGLNTLSIILRDDQVYDLVALSIVTFQLLAFVALFFVLKILYPSYMVFDEHEVRIYNKNILDHKISYASIKLLKYTSFRFTHLFTFLWDETNMMVIDYINEMGEKNHFDAKVFKHDFLKIRKKVDSFNNTSKNV